MKVLVVGSGGREHALVRKIKESKIVTELFCVPGNGGISCDALCPLPSVKATDIPAIVGFCADRDVDFVVVAPDDPLANGMVDALAAKGIRAFGPTAKAARIESSKVFSKNLMKKYGIPTAGYEVFENPAEALKHLKAGTFPAVIKADGLALGKGVVIAQDFAEAEEAVRLIMRDKIFGESGSRVVVEEFITGPEVSVLAFCDGTTLVPMVSSMDHKRAFDGNQGPNTGGMGTIAPNPYYTPEIAERCMQEIFLPTVAAMRAEGCPFSGCLYFGLMLTADGPKVIEYNCRFGDPEAQVVLPLLETDLLEILISVAEQRLDGIDIRWKTGAAACVVMASGGYPGKYETGKTILGLCDNGQIDGAEVFHAGTKLTGGGFVTAGGRVLGVTAAGDTLEAALKKTYAAAGNIRFEGGFCRSDIGKY